MLGDSHVGGSCWAAVALSVVLRGRCFWGNICVEQGINPLCQWSRYVGPAKISRAEGPLSCGWLLELTHSPQFHWITMFPICPELELRKSARVGRGEP